MLPSAAMIRARRKGNKSWTSSRQTTEYIYLHPRMYLKETLNSLWASKAALVTWQAPQVVWLQRCARHETEKVEIAKLLHKEGKFLKCTNKVLGNHWLQVGMWCEYDWPKSLALTIMSIIPWVESVLEMQCPFRLSCIVLSKLLLGRTGSRTWHVHTRTPNKSH